MLCTTYVRVWAHVASEQLAHAGVIFNDIAKLWIDLSRQDIKCGVLSGLPPVKV